MPKFLQEMFEKKEYSKLYLKFKMTICDVTQMNNNGDSILLMSLIKVKIMDHMEDPMNNNGSIPEAILNLMSNNRLSQIASLMKIK